MYTYRHKPLFPGDSTGFTADDSRLVAPGAWGAYNLRVRSNCQTTTAHQMDTKNLKILTFNVRTLRTEEGLVDLENGLLDIKWDVMGLSEGMERRL